MLTNARVRTNQPLLGYSISEISIFGLKLQESGSIATDLHGITRKEEQAEALATDEHGNKTKRKISHGITRKTRKEAEAEALPRKQNSAFS